MTAVTQYLWDPVSDCVLQEYVGDGNLSAEYTNEPAPFGPQGGPANCLAGCRRHKTLRNRFASGSRRL